MKPIRIFSPNIDFQAEISNYESLIFVRSWSGIGDLELRINRYKNYTETLKKGNIIVVGNQLHKAYIILHKEIELDEKGKITENWIIKALELKSVVGRRITLPPSHTAYDNRRGAAETVMKHYVDRNIVNPSNVARKIDQLVIAEDQGRGMTVDWSSRLKNVAEELSAISSYAKVGWNVRVDYDTKKWIFDVSEGKDLTVNQTENSPVIFSPEFDSIKEMSFSDSDMNFKNTAYIGGQGEGIDRRIVELGDQTGLSRFELFVDARDISEETDTDPPEPRDENEVINELENRGRQKLSEYETELFLEAQIMTHSTFEYEKDWDLGDRVTIQNKGWGVTMDTRITEVREIYETGGYQIEATFGSSRPTLIQKIKQELEQFSGEIRK